MAPFVTKMILGIPHGVFYHLISLGLVANHLGQYDRV